jgi:hypothetical protein
LRSVDDDYVRVLGMPVCGSGRVSDGAVINRTLARRLGPEFEDPQGRPIRVLLDDWVEMPIAGVIEDVPQQTGHLEAQPEVLIGFQHDTSRTEPNSEWVTLLVRTSARQDAAELFPELRRSLELQNGFSLGPLRSLVAVRERAERAPRAAIALAGVGSLLGIALLAIGMAPLGAARHRASSTRPVRISPPDKSRTR